MSSMMALFVFFFLTPLPSVHSGHAEECSALLQFKNSLKVNHAMETNLLCASPILWNFTSSPKTTSWKEGTDCCRASWDGITCNNVTGNVIGVDLTCSYLQGTLHSNSSLFSSLHHLQRLILRGNHLTGPIPSSICRMGSLVRLDLWDNDLSGSIPPCLGNLSNLQHLGLSYNKLEGPLPKTLANCTSLLNLDVIRNKISDTFPFWLKSLPLYMLQLSVNNFHGQIVPPDHATFPFPHLEYLLISNNQFTGQFPQEYFLHSNLTFVDLEKNEFYGSLPIPPIRAGLYDVRGNNFTGEIPTSFCNVTTLSQIYISNNSLDGKVPQCLINVNTGLEGIDLSMNRFQGAIPDILAPNNCSSLKSVNLGQNHLGGKPPRSWASCKQLEVLDLGDNEVEDVFPSWIETLPNLYGLVLRANRFYGPISNPIAIHPFPQLQIFDISSNNFSGIFPSQYMANFKKMMVGDKGVGYLKYVTHGWDGIESLNMIYKGVPLQLDRIQKALVVIDVSCNHFRGEIPKVIGKLQSLIGLNLSHNNFGGVIPSSVGNLTELEWLDVSPNNFTGEIPTALTNLTSLAIFNVSTNQLTGQIPRGKQFETFGIESFSGNPNLCGHPLPKPCTAEHQQEPPSASKDKEDAESWIEWRAVLMGYGSGTVIGLSIGYIFIQIRRPPSWLIKLVKRKRSRTANRPRKSSPGTHGRSRRPVN